MHLLEARDECHFGGADPHSFGMFVLYCIVRINFVLWGKGEFETIRVKDMSSLYLSHGLICMLILVESLYSTVIVVDVNGWMVEDKCRFEVGRVRKVLI